MKCLFALVVFVTFSAVFSVPVPDADAAPKPANADIKKEIVAKVRDALSTGAGKKALEEILDQKNKKDAGKKSVEVSMDVHDEKGNKVSSVQLAKKSTESEQEDELRNIIVGNVKDALEKGEGKDAIEQLVNGNDGGDGVDITEGKDVPAAISDELEDDADTTSPNFNDPAGGDTTEQSANTAPEATGGMISETPAGDEVPSNKIDTLDVESMLKGNGEENDYQFKDASDTQVDDSMKAYVNNPGYFVSEPFAADEDTSKIPENIQNDDGSDDISYMAELKDAPASDNTIKNDDQTVAKDEMMKETDMKDDPAASYVVPAGDYATADDDTTTKDRQEKGIVKKDATK